MIYLYIFIACVIFLFLEQAKGTENARPWMQWGFSAFFILFTGLRYETGPDFFSYQGIFSDPLLRKDMEPFFHFLMTMLARAKLGYVYFLFFVAALSITIKTYSIQKYSPYFFLSIVIALPVTFLSDMGQIRFSLAISTLWLSIPYILDKKLLKYTLVILLAASMHYSSLVFFPVYWICNKKINIYLIFGIWMACYFLSFTKFNEWFSSSVFNIGITEFTDKTNLYAEEDTGGGRYGVSLFGLLSKILVVILVYFTLPDETGRLQRILLNIYFIGGCFFFLFSFSEIYGTRFSLYFLSVEALAVPVAIQKIRDIKLHYLLISTFIIKAFYQYYTLVYISYPDMYLPYKNVLQLFY